MGKHAHKIPASLILFCFLVITILVAGCQTTSTSVPQEPEKKESRKIVDQVSREVELPQTVDRIVTTWKPATLMIFAVGGQDKLVGADDHSVTSKFLNGVYPKISTLPQVGDKTHGLNVEQIVACKPDVVFIWQGKGSEHVIKQLESQGIPAVVIVPESMEQMKETARLLGEILNTGEKVEKILTYYDDKLAMLDKALGNIPQDQRKRVYLAGAHGILSTCSQDLYQHFIIEKAGGIDVAGELKGYWNDVSAEQVVKWNPDVIVAVQYCKQGMPEVVKTNPQLQSIKAVKDNELYRFPSNLEPWDYPEPRSILGIMWLAKTLYPETFKDMDLIKEVDEFHQEFYGKTFTELGGKIDDKGIKPWKKPEPFTGKP